jgi:uncharacterized protein involved in exopolysaccharide biosynthesis
MEELGEDAYLPRAMPRSVADSLADDKLNVRAFLARLWTGKWLVIGGALAGVLLALAYVKWVAQPTYVAKMVVGQSDASPSGAGAGSRLPSVSEILSPATSRNPDFMRFLETLHSVRLAERLQDRYRLMQDFYGGWNSQTKQWAAPQGFIASFRASVRTLLGQPPLPRQPTAEGFADLLKRLFKVEQLPSSAQLQQVSMSAKDPELGKRVLQLAAQEADAIMREDHLVDKAARVDYLNTLIKKTDVVSQRSALDQILLSQQIDLMMLKADKFYSFAMIDPPSANPVPASPRVTLDTAVGFLLGGALGAMAALGRTQDAKTSASRARRSA